VLFYLGILVSKLFPKKAEVNCLKPYQRSEADSTDDLDDWGIAIVREGFRDYLLRWQLFAFPLLTFLA